jgi:transcriptional regulator with XRE-family HTH domain
MEPSDLVADGDAARLAAARQASGRDIGELAALLDISYEAYRDLESFDSEAVDCLSYDQLNTLADAIGLDLRRFFGAEGLTGVTFAELTARLQAIADEPASIAALEEEAGWEFRRHFDDPRTFGELPAIALAEIGAQVGIDWRSLLPPGGHRT